MKKKLLAIILSLVCCFACAFGLTACGDGSTDGEATEVKGKTYVFAELSVAYSSDFPESQKVDEEALAEMFAGTTLAFGTDGTFEWGAMQQTGTYTQERNVITFTVQEETYTGTVSGDDVILTDKMEDPESTAFVTMSIKYTVQKTDADGDTSGGDGDNSDTTAVKTVTEGEWQAALSKNAFINFTVTMKVGDITGYFKADLENNIYYAKGYSFGDNGGYTETYYTKEGDKYYIYDKSATAKIFTRRETDQSSFESGLYWAEPLAVLNFSANYSDFQFDGENYTTDKAELYNAKFGFADKKLVYAEVDAGRDELLIMEYSYGGTTITAPTDYVEAVVADDFITEDKWQAAFSEVFTAYTATSVQEGYSDAMVQIFDYERHIYYLTLAGYGTGDEPAGLTYKIMTKEGNNYYSYTSENNVDWVRESISEEDYNSFIRMYGGSLTVILQELIDKYYSFELRDYDYWADNVELTSIGTMYEVSVTFDADRLKVLEYTIDNVGMNMTTRIEFGVADIEIPTDYTEKA